MIFITDENFPKHGNRMLEAFDREHQVRPLLDYVKAGTPDVVWINQLGQWNPKPAVISGDTRILRNSVERQALFSVKIMWVALGSGWTNLDWETIFAWKIVKAWPDIRNSVTRSLRPAVFELSINGKLDKRFDL
jgi:hypothetical protein